MATGYTAPLVSSCSLLGTIPYAGAALDVFYRPLGADQGCPNSCFRG